MSHGICQVAPHGVLPRFECPVACIIWHLYKRVDVFYRSRPAGIAKKKKRLFWGVCFSLCKWVTSRSRQMRALPGEEGLVLCMYSHLYMCVYINLSRRNWYESRHAHRRERKCVNSGTYHTKIWCVVLWGFRSCCMGLTLVFTDVRSKSNATTLGLFEPSQNVTISIIRISQTSRTVIKFVAYRLWHTLYELYDLHNIGSSIWISRTLSYEYRKRHERW